MCTPKQGMCTYKKGKVFNFLSLIVRVKLEVSLVCKKAKLRVYNTPALRNRGGKTPELVQAVLLVEGASFIVVTNYIQIRYSRTSFQNPTIQTYAPRLLFPYHLHELARVLHSPRRPASCIDAILRCRRRRPNSPTPYHVNDHSLTTCVIRPRRVDFPSDILFYSISHITCRTIQSISIKV